MDNANFNINGLNQEQVISAQKKYGFNRLAYKKENIFWEACKKLIRDPMVLLLLVASIIYFVTDNIGDGIFLVSAIILISAISLYQDSRSHHALEKLKDFTQPKSKVIRDGKAIYINSEHVVVGDSLIVEEGTAISADGMIVHSNDFSVNESILTGESLAVSKDKDKTDNFVFHGTTVASGLAIVTVTEIGDKTKLGKIGKSLENIKEEPTPLELQINNFVKKMALVGGVVFLIVWAINYVHSYQIIDSLLQALTLAMSILPQEIPVAFTTFMALGAWRLMKHGIVVKQMKTVETLGSATVICTDKTGTITENRMSLAKLFVLKNQSIVDAETAFGNEANELITMAMWASEPIPFDAMEVALHEAYQKANEADARTAFRLIHEYPLGGKPPMMTHVFEDNSGNRIIAAKGAPEAIIAVSILNESEINQINKAIDALTSEGFRALGVGEAIVNGTSYPKTQQEFSFHFKGIVAFYDPPKKDIHAVLEHFHKAGIAVKIITGDNAATTTAIAKEIGFRGYEKSISGEELMNMSETELNKCVQDTQIFTRMFPEAKLKIINSLKAQHETVAMTGDGVNDGPALKAAHIGIAMGKKGTEIAKQAASLILVTDDLSKMVDAVAMGRRIYTNLKKAIQFIISIHIPIILMVFIPLAMNWLYPNIFSPLHVIFLELVMGPTCSIVYENEPMEKNTMSQKPRPYTTNFFNWKELSTSIIQGVIITAGTLFSYQFAIYKGGNEEITRTMVFTTLITANIFLTLVNRSFYYSILTTMKYKNNLVIIVIGITMILTGLLIYVDPLTAFFKFQHLNISQLTLCIVVGFLSVIWYELIKWRHRSKIH